LEVDLTTGAIKGGLVINVGDPEDEGGDDDEDLFVKPESETETMEDWLREQAELIQSQINSKKMGMVQGHPVYFGTRRCTYSDVLSIITTTRPIGDGLLCDDPMNENLGLGPAASLAAKRGLPRNAEVPLKDSKYTSPLRRDDDVVREEHYRKNVALWREKDKFMRKLQTRRDHRMTMESTCAAMIQKAFRGFHLRKHWKKHTQKMKTRKRIRFGLRKVTKGTGMLLEERDRKMKKTEDERKSTLKVQRQWRRFLGERVALKERKCRYEEKLNAAATCIECMARKRFSLRVLTKEQQRYYEWMRMKTSLSIQRIFRGRLGRMEASVRQYQLQVLACMMVQRPYKRYLARKATRKEQHRREEEEVNMGAIDIQRMWRGKCDRRRVANVMNIEAEELQEAAVLSVQRCFRGLLCRHIARAEAKRQLSERRLCAILDIQRCYRAYAGKCYYALEQERVRTDIFTQARLGNADAVSDLFSGFGTSVVHTPKDTDAHGNTVFIVACRWGHKKIARRCLKFGMKMNVQNDIGRTGLELAVIYGHGELAEYLLSKKAEVSYYGRTMLHEGAKNGLFGVCEALLNKGVDPNQIDVEFGRIHAIHEAAKAGNHQIIELLIHRGSEIDLQNNDGWTPLHFASDGGHVESVLLLMNQGADVSLTDKMGRTPWRLALANGHEQVALELRQRWSELTGIEAEFMRSDQISDDQKAEALTAASEGRYQDVEAALDSGLPVNFADPQQDDKTMFMAMAEGGHKRIGQLLLQKGVDIHQTDANGRNALHFSAAHPNMSIWLVDEGCDISLADFNGVTPLHLCAEYGTAFVTQCKYQNLDINAPTVQGKTVLHYAAKGLQTTFINTVVAQLGANVDLADINGATPIHYCALASESTHLADDVVRCFAGNKATLDLADKNGETALHYAAKSGHHEACAALLDCGASVKAVDKEGRTPAYFAMQARDSAEKCLRNLLQFHSDVHHRDNDTYTILHTAIEMRNEACLDLCIEFGANLLEEYNNNVAEVAGGESDPNIKFRENPLHVACRTDFAAACEKILAKATAPEELLSSINGNGKSPIEIAVKFGAIKSLEVLANKGAQFSSSADSIDGESLLHVFAKSEAPNRAVLQFLVGQGMEIDDLDSGGETPLMIACRHATFDMTAVEALVESGGATNIILNLCVCVNSPCDPALQTLLLYPACWTYFLLCYLLLASFALTSPYSHPGHPPLSLLLFNTHQSKPPHLLLLSLSIMAFP
jgi:ankyrin repeat protein